MKQCLLLVGTYSQDILYGTGDVVSGKGEGILSYIMDLDTAVLTRRGVIGGKGTANPSYLTMDPARRHVYTVNEIKEYDGKPTGVVSSFSFDQDTHTFTLLNIRETGGTDPCYIIVNDKGTHVLTVNYMTGIGIVVYPIAADGRLLNPTASICHYGASVDKIRQTGPHCHSIVLDRQNQYAIVAELGLDKLMVYQTDFGNGTLALQHEIPVTPGQGPRHMIFNRAGTKLYLINELGNTIMVFSYNEDTGMLVHLQTVPTITDGFDGFSITADIHMTPDERFLYGSNRGHNSIVIYKIDFRTGLLDYVGMSPSGGHPPRGFVIDPTGRFMLVCNHDSNCITTFEIHPGTGNLTKIRETPVLTPVCAKLYPL